MNPYKHAVQIIHHRHNNLITKYEWNTTSTSLVPLFVQIPGKGVQQGSCTEKGMNKRKGPIEEIPAKSKPSCLQATAVIII